MLAEILATLSPPTSAADNMQQDVGQNHGCKDLFKEIWVDVTFFWKMVDFLSKGIPLREMTEIAVALGKEVVSFLSLFLE